MDCNNRLHGSKDLGYGDDIDQAHLPQILYEDGEGDSVLLASDSNFVASVNYAKTS